MTFRSKVSIVVLEGADVCPFFASIKLTHSPTANCTLNIERLKIIRVYVSNFIAQYIMCFLKNIIFTIRFGLLLFKICTGGTYICNSI